MLSGLLKKIFGSRNDRLVRQYMHTVRKINAFEAEISALSDEALRGKTAEFRQRVADGEALDAALADGCKLVLIETPSNPLLRGVDVADR